MKRFFFSMMALTAVAIGCTQSALLETPSLGQEISFDTYVGRTPITKAETVDEAYLQKPDEEGGGFRVFGYLTNADGRNVMSAMNNKLVTYETDKEGSRWAYEGLVYWPDESSESTMSFVAYSHNAANLLTWTGDETTKKQELTFTVDQDIDNQVDFLATALQEGLTLSSSNKVTNGAVKLQFHHLLSRLGFKVETTTSTKVSIHDLTFSGRMFSKGMLDLTTATGDEIPALVGTNKTNVSYVYLTDADTEVPVANVEPQRVPRSGSEYLMIMPHTIGQGDYHEVEVTYSVGEGKPRTASVEIEQGFEFVQGKAYEFILHISTSAIKFTITEDGWDDVNEEDTEYPIEPSPDEPVYVGVANSVTTNSAFIPVTVNHDGLAKVAVVYRKFGDTTDWDELANGTVWTSPADGQPSGVTISGLESNTKYEYRAYSQKTAGAEKIFSPVEESAVPTFYTMAVVELDRFDVNSEDPDAGDVQFETATASGSCKSSLDNIEECGFLLAIHPNTPTIDVYEKKITATLNTADGTFEAQFEDLQSNTRYNCRAYVKNAEGIVSYSNAEWFRTLFEFGDVDEEDNTGSGWN